MALLLLCLKIFFARIIDVTLATLRTVYSVKGKTLLAGIIGLFTDFLFSDSIGISAVLFMLIGYSGEILQKRFPKNSKITLIIMSSITTGIYELLRVCYRYIFFSSQMGFVQFITTVAIELLFNALLIIILYPIINKSAIVVDDTFNGNDTITKYF